MRINLDEPVPDDRKPVEEAAVEEPSEEEAPEVETDELIIRRDEPRKRRKRTGPKPLTPGQQRALIVLLVVVIAVAVVSLGFYVNRLRRPPIQLPDTGVVARPAPPVQPRSAPSRVQRPTRPPVYQGPPPRTNEPLEEPLGSDSSEPAEGIH